MTNHSFSGTLQYLGQDDLKRYLDDLLKQGDHLGHDSSYLQIFHEEHLGKAKADKKRDSECVLLISLVFVLINALKL